MGRRKVMMLVDVDMDQANEEGLKFAFNTAFQGVAEVDRIFETIYSEGDNVGLDELNISMTVEGKCEDEYTVEQMKKISEFASNDDAFGDGMDQAIDFAIEHLEAKGVL